MVRTKEQIEKELKELLLKIIDVEPEELKPNAHFFKDLGVDSIKAIEITVAIEKYFKISVGEEDVANLATLSDASEFIYNLLKKNNS